MNRSRKTTLAVIVGVGFIAGLALAAAVALPWGSGWRQVPPGELFVTTPPAPEQIAGVYHLTAQTITPAGLSVLAGRTCELELRPDGSFTATNYPRWSLESQAAEPPAVEFISTTGRWRCDKLGIIYDGHPCWGVVFADTPARIDPLALRGAAAPYDLMLTYGDADEGREMTFTKKK